MVVGIGCDFYLKRNRLVDGRMDDVFWFENDGDELKKIK